MKRILVALIIIIVVGITGYLTYKRMSSLDRAEKNEILEQEVQQNKIEELEEQVSTLQDELEAQEDQDGAWRRHINRQLETGYRDLFAQLDLLLMLKAPDFDSVHRWRFEQEQKLATSKFGVERNKLMDKQTLSRFIQHYERLTLHNETEMPDRADVVLLLIDAAEGVTAQDAHVAGMALDKTKSVVVIVNKWDLVKKDSFTMVEYTEKVRSNLNFLEFVPVMFISALTGKRVSQVIPTALRVQEERMRRIPTGELNRLLKSALQHHAPPSKSGRRLKFLYVAQVRTDPPTFLFHVNDPKLVHFSYSRFLENRIREKYGFLGTPLRLMYRKRA